MTRAKDISKITTDANFGGTLDVTGETTLSTHLNMGDNDIIKLGDSADLQIYHDGSHSYVKDNGTGNLLIQGSTAIVLEDPDGNNMIYAEDGGPVYLYNNGSQKLATTSTGIDVTGTVTADRLLSIDTTGTNYSMIENRGASALKDTLVLRNFSSNSGTGAKLIFAPTTSDVTTRHSAIAGVQNVNNNIDLRFYTSSGNDPVERMRIAQNGDISFYEDTGTTPKLFWDASAESLGIGTSSPASLLEIKATSLNRANGIALRGSGANDVLYMYPSADNVATIEHLIDGTTNTGGVLSINPQGGNVGIGTSSPSQKVQVSGAGSQYVSVVSTNSGNTGVLFGDSGQVDQGYVLYANSDDSLRIGTSNTERMRIRSTGKIGLGTSNADAELHIEPVSGGANASILLSNDGRTQYFRIQNNETDDALVFNANDTSERMRIDSSGNLIVGGTSSSINNVGAKMTVSGGFQATKSSSAPLGLNRISTDGDIAEFRHIGTVVGSISVTSTATSYNTTSDKRLKDNIQTITDGTEKVMAINAVTHTWKNKPDTKPVHGFIAQEMQQIIPEAVNGNPDSEEMMSMDYGRITPLLVASLQDAHKKIKQLENKINNMENK